MKTVQIKNKVTKIASILAVIGCFMITGMGTYVIASGSEYFALPDKYTQVRYHEDGFNVSTMGFIQSRSVDKVIKVVHVLGNIAKKQGGKGVLIVPAANVEQHSNPDSLYSGDPDDYTVVAYYSIDKKVIVLGDYANVDKNLCHEMGHFVDYDCLGEGNSYSETDEWQSIVAEEYTNTNWDMYYSRDVEFFAETFALYYYNPAYLQEHCPRAYAVMDKLVAQYNS